MCTHPGNVTQKDLGTKVNWLVSARVALIRSTALSPVFLFPLRICEDGDVRMRTVQCEVYIVRMSS